MNAKDFADEMFNNDKMRPSRLIKGGYAAIYKEIQTHVTDEASSLQVIGGALEVAIQTCADHPVALRIATNAISLAIRSHYECLLNGGWTKEKMLHTFNSMGSKAVSEASKKEDVLLKAMQQSDAPDADAFLKARVKDEKDYDVSAAASDKELDKIDLGAMLSPFLNKGKPH